MRLLQRGRVHSVVSENEVLSVSNSEKMSLYSSPSSFFSAVPYFHNSRVIGVTSHEGFCRAPLEVEAMTLERRSQRGGNNY